jgi:hypothetical protein
VDRFVLVVPHMCSNLDNGSCNVVRRSSTLVLDVKDTPLDKCSYNPTIFIAFPVSTACLDQRFTDYTVAKCKYSALKSSNGRGFPFVITINVTVATSPHTDVF